MTPDDEFDVAIREWNDASLEKREAIVKEAKRLRSMALAAPPFNCKWHEDTRLTSREIAKMFEEEDVGVAPAVEVVLLNRLLFCPKVKAWEAAFQIIQSGLGDPRIAEDSAMRAFFQKLLNGLNEDCPGSRIDSKNPEYGCVNFLIEDHFIDPHTKKRIVSEFGRLNGVKPHINHNRADLEIPNLWAEMKSKGKSKTEAAREIAPKVGLAISSVRKKLQGM